MIATTTHLRHQYVQIVAVVPPPRLAQAEGRDRDVARGLADAVPVGVHDMAWQRPNSVASLSMSPIA